MSLYKLLSYRIFLLIIPLTLAIFLFNPCLVGAKDPKKILVIHSYDPQFRMTAEAEAGIEKVFATLPPNEAELQVEYLDAKRYNDAEYLTHVLETVYMHKLARRSFDLVLAVDNDALTFVRRHRGDLFAGVPVVFCGINNFTPAMIAGDNDITGVADSPSFEETIDTALILHPDTEELVFIGSASNETGRTVRAALNQLQGKYVSRSRFTFWDDLPIEDVTARLRTLPPNRLVFIYGFVKGRSGFVLPAEDNIRRVREATNTPIYSFWSFFLGRGIVGGKLVSNERQGELGAAVALQVLRGTAPSSIPVVTSEANEFQFDHKELQRFNIKASRLPPGSRIINLPSPFYSVNREYFWMALTLIAILAGTSAALIRMNLTRKRAEKVLDRERSQLHALVHTIPDLIFLKDPDGVYLTCNNRLERLYGAQETAIIGKTDYDFVGSEEADFFRAHDRLAIEAGRPMVNEEWVTYADDGHKELMETIKTPMFDVSGKLIGVLGIARDITAMRRAEESLRISETRLKESQRVGNVGSWEFDLVTSGVWWSDQVYRIFEMDRNTPVTYETFSAALHPDDREMVLRKFAESVENHTAYNIEHRLLMPDGRVKHVHVQCETSYDVTGKPLRSLGMFQDITERKLAEEAQQKLAVQLRQAQKMEAIGRLAGGIAHDFNNKLMVILGYAEMALQQERVDDRYREQLVQIITAAEHSRAITRQLLAFSRQELVSPQLVDLNEVIQNAKKSLARLIGEDIRFETHPGDGLWPISIDPSQLDQIIMNLALNARDSMPDGGMLSIETGNITAENAVLQLNPDEKQGEYVQLSVSDTGCGMNKESLERLFEPFFTTKKQGKGTGLGLATVYGIVTQNRGFVNVYSEPGLGTTFRLYFPRATAIMNGSGSAVTSAPRAATTARILLVEDDEAVRMVAGEMLRMSGHEVLVAVSPQEAIDICKNDGRPIDIVLTDVIMPQMNGKEMQQHIAAIRPATRFLFMSGYTADVIAQKGVLEEGVHFIQKPFDNVKLRARIQEVLAS